MLFCVLLVKLISLILGCSVSFWISVLLLGLVVSSVMMFGLNLVLCSMLWVICIVMVSGRIVFGCGLMIIVLLVVRLVNRLG